MSTITVFLFTVLELISYYKLSFI